MDHVSLLIATPSCEDSARFFWSWRICSSMSILQSDGQLSKPEIDTALECVVRGSTCKRRAANAKSSCALFLWPLHIMLLEVKNTFHASTRIQDCRYSDDAHCHRLEPVDKFNEDSVALTYQEALASKLMGIQRRRPWRRAWPPSQEA